MDFVTSPILGSSIPTVRVSAAALDVVRSVRAGEEDGDNLALWIEANPGPQGGLTYDLWFQPHAEASAADEQIELEAGLWLVVPAPSRARLRGSSLELANGGLALSNPNDVPLPSAPPVAARGSLDGPVAARVASVIEEHVNPSIAGHGGFATLVSVDGDTAFITMGGGCRGCAMSTATLRQGIEVAIRENVPEIAMVVDVTDHTAGSQPYYS